MNSKIKVYNRENNEIQRVHVVCADNWHDVDFFHPTSEPNKVFESFCNIYSSFLVPAFPWIFKQMLLFCLPEEDGYNTYKLYEYANILREGLKIKKGQPVFLNDKAKDLYQRLEMANCTKLVCGKRPSTQIIPIANRAGYMSECELDARVKVNASFFIMDCFDVSTEYDVVTQPFGFAVKDGVVFRPPLFGREAFIVKKDGSVSIEKPALSDLTMNIYGIDFVAGKNARIFCRPEYDRAPLEATKNTKDKSSCNVKNETYIDLVIVADEIVDVLPAGTTKVPASGFVLRIRKEDCSFNDIKMGDKVVYKGCEDIVFAIQVGNSTVIDGQMVLDFQADYYDIKRLGSTQFPPSLYPLNYKNARAARIALGADKEGKPMFVWAEGKGKYGHVPGQDSCGASLSELAQICLDLGMHNGINLDGGGSAQLLYNNERLLDISDRSMVDYSCRQRPVPEGLIIR